MWWIRLLVATLCSLCLYGPLRAAQLSSSLRRDVRVEVSLSRAVPQCIVLMGGAAHDSVWESANDGLYHFTVKDFRPGYYRLHLTGLDLHVPLLLIAPASTVRVTLRADSLLSAIRVEGANEAEVYAKAHGALRRYERARGELEPLEARGGVGDLASSLLLALRREADSTLRCLEPPQHDGDASISRTVRALLRMQREGLWGEDSVESWWPEWLVQDSLLSQSVELKYRVDDFLRAAHRAGVTREEQDSIYARSFAQWVGLQMAPSVAEVICRRVEYTFSDLGYYPLWRAARVKAFPNVALARALREEPRGEDAPLWIRNFRFKDLQGKGHYMVSRDAAYTVIVVWSVWCEVCQGVVPGVLTLVDSLRVPGGVALRSVAIEASDPFVRAHLEHHSLPGESVEMKQSEMDKLLDGLGVEATPAYFLFDRRGVRVSQPLEADQLMESLRRLAGVSRVEGGKTRGK